MPERTVVATGGRFVKIVRFLVNNTCQAWLADQLGCFGMAARFGKLSTKMHHQNFKNPLNLTLWTP